MRDPMVDKIRQALPEEVARVNEVARRAMGSDTPLEMDKLAEKGVEFRAVLDFLQWCHGQGAEIGQHNPIMNQFIPLGVRPERLTAAWLGIDLDKVESERQKFLDQFIQERQ